jgi:Leucine-rich repeat (LRR) protein
MNRLETIREKLLTLIKTDKKKKIFGSDSHLYQLNEPLQQVDIDVFESANQVELSDEYKSFLTQIANGGAGLFYGLFSLDDALEEATNYSETVSKDFVYDNAHFQTFLRHYNECIEAGADEEIKYPEVPENLSGVLFLSEYGCGGFYVLVVKGEQAGTVWYLQEEDYLFPCFHESGKQWDFFDWYENWLDSSLEELKPKAKKQKTELGTENSVLNYDGHQLSEIPETVFANTGLKKLIFSRNNLKTFPERITEFKELKNLDLSMNPFKEVSEKIGELTHLKKLNLSYNYHTALPESLANLQKLEELAMFYNYNIKSIPDVVARLASLKLLHFSNCGELKKVPDQIGDLKNLEALFLNDTILERLPESVGQLTQLKYVKLSNTKLKKLPDSFDKLINLEHLFIDIPSLDLNDAFEKIKNLPKLSLLSISLLQQYPTNLKELKYVKTLIITQNYDLYRKGFERLPLPESITEIPNLETLDLTNNNQLVSLPESIGKMNNLKNLHISSTAIKSLPESLQHLSKLEVVEGLLNTNPEEPWGILPEEKQKLIEWFPNAKIRIW